MGDLKERPGARSSPSVSYHSSNEPVYYLFQATAVRERSQPGSDASACSGSQGRIRKRNVTNGTRF